jgi:hypothetical protein
MDRSLAETAWFVSIAPELDTHIHNLNSERVIVQSSQLTSQPAFAILNYKFDE